jgi:phosphoribosylanthranilate isomerase
LTYFQWHGDLAELPEFTPGARMKLRSIVAFRVRDQKSLTDAENWLREAKKRPCLPAAILIDGYQKDSLGGTGTAPPWELLAGFKPDLPLILAGGLTPENVTEAIQMVRPYAVDVASGVESSPGKKDVEKMKRFLDAVYSAG